MVPNMFKIAGELTPGGDPRRRPHDRDARAVDLRRPQRRDARPRDGLGACCARRLGAGGARLRAGRPRGDPAGAGSVPALLRRVPHEPRDRQDRRCSPTTTSRALVREDDVVAFRLAAADAGRAGRPRDGAEPGRVLPGPRGGQPVPPRRARHRRRRSWTSSPTAPGAATASSSTAARPTPSGSSCVMGSAARRGRGDGRRARRRGRAGRHGARCGCTGRSRPTRSCGAAADGARRRRARPHEGAGRGG